MAPAASPANVNLSQTILNFWTYLNANGAGDAVYWTTSDLLHWVNQAAKRLALNCGVFTSYDRSISLATGTAAYALPAATLRTLQADVAGTVLKARNVIELESLDDNWTASSGEPEAFILEGDGLAQIRIYKTPVLDDNGLALGLVITQYPPEMTSSGAILAAPQCIEEYFTFYLLAEARIAQETRAQMPEVAKWAKGVVDLLDSVIASYWGKEMGT